MTYTRKTKWLAVLLTVAMLAVMLPAVMLTAAEVDPNAPESLKAENGNLAIGATVISTFGEGSAAGHGDGNWQWDARLLNDGNLNNTDYTGQLGNGGYHSLPGSVGYGAVSTRLREEWVGLDFGSAKVFDQVVIYPCRDTDGLVHSFPNAFTIDISNDKETWTTVYAGGNDGVAFEFAPLTFRFSDVEARYVRLRSLSLSPDKNNAYYMKLCEFGVMDANASYCPNYALTANVSSSAYHGDGATWSLGGINDGNQCNFNTAQDRGQFVGWHTNTGAYGQDGWITFDMGESKKIDQVVVYPGTERFKHGVQGDGSYIDNLYLPAKFTVQTSDDNATWTDVATLDTMPTTYQPVTMTFEPKEARYVRVYMTKTDQPIKLSEIEIYDTTAIVDPAEVVIPAIGENVALGAKAIYSTFINSGGWNTANLNNGVIEGDGGFTSGQGATNWAGVQFEKLTKVNQITLYSAAVSGADVGAWSGIPKSFTVEYSTNGKTWTAVQSVTLDSVPAGQTAVTVNFDAVVALAIRVNGTEFYPKKTDGDRTYLQVAELEVKLVATELSTDEFFAGYLQNRSATDADGKLVSGKHDLRMVLVGDMAKLDTISVAEIALIFTLKEGGTKTFDFVLGGNDNDFGLYKTITASGEVYEAAEGDAIFGAIIKNIPDGAYTDVSVVITNANGGAELYTGSTSVE